MFVDSALLFFLGCIQFIFSLSTVVLKDDAQHLEAATLAYMEILKFYLVIFMYFSTLTLFFPYNFL
jgi:hypothetical protein